MIASRRRVQSLSGATDCHLHIFGPTSRYPYTPNRAYTPPEASLASYDALAANLGLERMVIVQPSVYGKDNACTLDMAAAAGKAAGPRRRCHRRQLQRFAVERHERPRRARHPGQRADACGLPLEQIQRLAERIAPLGWHIQFWISGPQLVALADVIRALPVPASSITWVSSRWRRE